jgi:hypothetical protein
MVSRGIVFIITMLIDRKTKCLVVGRTSSNPKGVPAEKAEARQQNPEFNHTSP